MFPRTCLVLTLWVWLPATAFGGGRWLANSAAPSKKATRDATALNAGTAVPFTLPAVTQTTLAAQSFSIVIPAGTTRTVFELRTQTPNVDIDLYIRRNQEVGRTADQRPLADFVSEGLSGDETITVENPQPATYFLGFGIFTFNVASSATIRVTLTSSSGGTSTASYNGAWSGTTSQGRPVTLTVANNVVTQYVWGANWSVGGNCPTGSTTTTNSNLTISNDAFSDSTISGSFRSETAASGTLRAVLAINTPNQSCNATQTLTWTATRGGVSPPPVCNPAVTPESASVPAAGGDVSLNVTAANGCAWTVTNTNSWVQVRSGSAGSGAGMVVLSVAANPSAQVRTGTVTVAGRSVTITQQATDSCNVTLAPRSEEFPPAGGTGTVAVQATPRCAWTATASADWITITEGVRGTGNGTVRYSVAAHTGRANRSGAITVAGASLDVTQNWGDFSVLNSASLRATPLSPQSLVTLNGRGFATSTESATEPAIALGGVGVRVTDSSGAERTAALVLVSPERIHFVTPFESLAGPATVQVRREGSTVSAPARVENAGPGLFSADNTGTGLAMGVAQNVDADGQVRLSNPLSRSEEGLPGFLPVPVRHGLESQRTLLTVLGTGFRFAQQLQVRVGTTACEVVAFGPDAEAPLLDSVRFVLPRSLAGQGDLAVVVTADGVVSNPVNITVGAPLPLPRLTSVTPNAIEAGGTAQIRVVGVELANTTLRIQPSDGITLSDVQTTATAISATVTVATTASVGARSVLASNDIGDSNGLAFTIRPQPVTIRTVTPSSMARGTDPFPIRIEGENLGSVTEVVFSPSAGIGVVGLEATADRVTATVQVGPTATVGRGTIVVRSPNGVSNTLPFEVLPAPPPLPVLTSISPTTLEVSQLTPSFTVSGQNLGGSPNIVFEPSQGLTVLGRSASGSLFLQVDNEAAPGERQVTVTTAAGRSNALPLTIRPKSGSFTISNLRATTPSGFQGSFTLTMDFSDPSGSAASGVNFAISFPDLGFLATSATLQGTVSGRNSGTISFEQQARGTRIGRVTVSLTNSLGHRSNLLTSSF